MAISPDVVERARARVGMLLVNKYRLDRLLGIGGMAAVYAATHRNRKRVAVKILHPELSIDDTVKTRFLREGYAANSVDHPGAVAVFDDDVTEDGSAFLVMELLAGETLDVRADRKGGTLPLTEVLPIADQLLDVLVAAHEKGLVHRDIKPDNLFLTTEGQLKVLDFGIARLRELSPDGKSTGIGSFMGTPAFMSPEQARGRWDQVDSRSDVWAVGATIFNLLTGRSVHETDSVGEQLVMAATVPAPPLVSVLPRIEPLVAELVDRALAFDKTARWPDVVAMQKILRQAMQVVEPARELSVPKTSLPSVDFDHEGETLAVIDTGARGRDSGPAALDRGSHRGGSVPSSVTSRTGSDPQHASDTSRRARGLLFVGIGAAAALLTVLLWPRARSADPETAADATPFQSGASAAATTTAKATDNVLAAEPVPMVNVDAGQAAASAPLAVEATPPASKPRTTSKKTAGAAPSSVPSASTTVKAQAARPPPASSAPPARAGADPFAKRY